jgi:hydroxymethylpyrimidine pyrophosphatase-like HAD family hydrolase
VNPPSTKIVFFDIDWTLYDHKNHEWPSSAIFSLRALQAQGYKLILCTARPYHSFFNFGVMDLGIRWDGYIASAGGVAFADGRYLLKTLMDSKDVINYVTLCGEESLSMELVEVETRKLVFPLTECAMGFYRDYNEVVPPRGSFEGEEVIGFNFFAPKEYDEEFIRAFPQLIYSRYSPWAVDIMGEPHLKGAAVAKIIKYYGLRKEEALGFGDDLQDISVAEQVGTFVCMGQGKDEVKEKSSFVTTPVWDNGIYNALVHLGLVKKG